MPPQTEGVKVFKFNGKTRRLSLRDSARHKRLASSFFASRNQRNKEYCIERLVAWLEAPSAEALQQDTELLECIVGGLASNTNDVLATNTADRMVGSGILVGLTTLMHEDTAKIPLCIRAFGSMYCASRTMRLERNDYLCILGYSLGYGQEIESACCEVLAVILEKDYNVSLALGCPETFHVLWNLASRSSALQLASLLCATPQRDLQLPLLGLLQASVSDSNSSVRYFALKALEGLAEHHQYWEPIQQILTPSVVVALCGDSDDEVASVAMELLSSLVLHDPDTLLRHGILPVVEKSCQRSKTSDAAIEVLTAFPTLGSADPAFLKNVLIPQLHSPDAFKRTGILRFLHHLCRAGHATLAYELCGEEGLEFAEAGGLDVDIAADLIERILEYFSELKDDTPFSEIDF